MLLFIDGNNILYKNQYGFIAMSSTVHSHIHNYNWFPKKIIKWLLFLDFKKAFYTVNHDILLKKLEYYGFKGKSITLLKSYLSNRSQLTNLDY